MKALGSGWIRLDLCLLYAFAVMACAPTNVPSDEVDTPSTKEDGLSAAANTTLTNLFDRSGKAGTGWIQGDGVGSYTHTDGATFWTFGDSVIGTVGTDKKIKTATWVNNAIVMTQGSTFTTFVGANTTALLPGYTGYDGAKRFYWLYAATWDAGLLRVFAGRIKELTSGCQPGFCFQTDGTVIASFNYNPSGSPKLTLANAFEAPGSGSIHWGEALWKDTSTGYFYIFGSKSNGLTLDTYAARVAISATLFGTWEYFGSGQWNASMSAATPVLANSAIQSVTKLSNGKYAATYTSYPGDKLWEAYSTSPQGPFTGGVVLYTIPQVDNTHWSYIPRAHPAFNSGTSAAFGYSVNWRNVSGIPSVGWMNDYRPRFVQITR